LVKFAVSIIEGDYAMGTEFEMDVEIESICLGDY